MHDIDFFISKLSVLSGLTICSFPIGKIPAGDDSDCNVIRKDPELRSALIRAASSQEVPVIYQDSYEAFYLCLISDGLVYTAGPLTFANWSDAQQHRFYYGHGLKNIAEKKIPWFSLSAFLSASALLIKIVTGKEYRDEELIEANRLEALSAGDPEDETPGGSILSEEERTAHHTYMEERRLLDCVRRGDTKEALRLNLQMDTSTGIMSENSDLHFRKLVTVAITLTVRAAIDGGLTPAEGYRISDYYLQKMDRCKTIPSLLHLRNDCVKELTDRVANLQRSGKTSSYVGMCCDYINKHYREKILIQDIADGIGISKSHLSRLFSCEMGKTIQDYILEVRIERAANLLLYSSEPIASIAGYVCFPSQSYLGKVFKKYKNMTPKEYRDRFKPHEFAGNLPERT